MPKQVDAAQRPAGFGRERYEADARQRGARQFQRGREPGIVALRGQHQRAEYVQARAHAAKTEIDDRRPSPDFLLLRADEDHWISDSR